MKNDSKTERAMAIKMARKYKKMTRRVNTAPAHELEYWTKKAARVNNRINHH